MALKIRLRRMGRKNAPTYRMVVAESSMPRDGRIVENIGHYNPRTDPLTLSVDRARALYWIERGAIPTDTAKALLKRAGVFRPESELALVAAAAATFTEGAKSTAKKAGAKAKSAAAKVADVVQDAAEDVREAAGDVVEKVTGAGDAEAGDAGNASEAADRGAKGEPEVAAEAGAEASEAGETPPQA